MGKEWTDEDIDFLKTHYGDYTYKWIGKRLDRTENAVQLKISKLGLKKYRTTLPTIVGFYVYRLPDCPKCDKLEQLLEENGIKFTEESYTSGIQSAFVMMNEFDDPPILYHTGEWISSKTMFDGMEILSWEVLSFVGRKFKPRVGSSQYDTHVYCTKCGVWIWKEVAGERCGVCGSLYSTRSPRRR